MPSTYAHYRFGTDLLKTLPKRIKEEIKENEQLFRIGLHGPDLFYYYQLLLPNEIRKMGNVLHQENAIIFFENAAKLMLSTEQETGMRAYLYGFICHFALDSECHPYIGTYEKEKGISHSQIEGDFDRYLMLMDGKNPASYIRTHSIIATEHNANIISRFFPMVSEGQMVKALWSMKRCTKWLTAPSTWKKILLYGLFQLTGKYEQLKGLVITEQANPKCEETTQKLVELYQQSLVVATNLIGDFRNRLEKESILLCDRFERTYGMEKETQWKKEKVPA